MHRGKVWAWYDDEGVQRCPRCGTIINDICKKYCTVKCRKAVHETKRRFVMKPEEREKRRLYNKKFRDYCRENSLCQRCGEPVDSGCLCYFCRLKIEKGRNR